MSHEEDPIVGALIDLFSKHDIKCLLNVGAEDGYEANEIRKAIGCRVVCCEPDPKGAPCSPDIEWHEVLIGDVNSVEPFYINANRGLSSVYHRADSMEILAQMPMCRMDTFCEKNFLRPDALIIDVEGATMDVLKGCGTMLDDVKAIYAEVNHDSTRGPDVGKADDVDAYLKEHGFKRVDGLPSYSAGTQSNWSWTR